MGSEEFLGQGQEPLDAGLQLPEGFQALLAERVVFRRQVAGGEVGIEEFEEGGDLAFGGVELGAEEAEVVGAEQFGEVGLDFVVVLAVTRFPDLSDGVPSKELAGPGLGTGLAQAQGLGDFVEGQGGRGKVQETENLTAGSWKPQALADPGGHLDHLEACPGER